MFLVLCMAALAVLLSGCDGPTSPDENALISQVTGCWEVTTSAHDTMPGVAFFPFQVVFTDQEVGPGRYGAYTLPARARDFITRWWPTGDPGQLRAGMPQPDTELPQPNRTALYLIHRPRDRLEGWWTALEVELPVVAIRCAS